MSSRISTITYSSGFSRRANCVESCDLSQPCSVRPEVHFFHMRLSQEKEDSCQHYRILDALSPESDSVDDHDDLDSTETASVIISSNGRPPSAISGTKVPKYEAYRHRLEPLVELEERLTRLLSSPDEDEATHLGPSHPSWESYANYLHSSENGNPKGSASGWSNGRPAPTIFIPSKQQSYPSPVSPVTRTASSGSQVSSPSSSSVKLKGKEVSVHTSTNWKKAFALGGRSKSPQGGEIEGWWEDPEDPVHALNACASAMLELWRDPNVKQRLQEKRLRLEESSGL